jgi:hypothetical protein
MSDADYEQRLTSTGRNDRCPCDSGKKYKKCHLAEDQGKRSAALKAAEDKAEAKTAEDIENAENGDEESDKSDATGKKKRSVPRQKQQGGSKTQSSDAKAKNMPRRSAV